MNATLAAAIIFVVFAVGDMISAKTKAIVSMLLVASVVFLAGFVMRARRKLSPVRAAPEGVIEARKVDGTWVAYGWEPRGR